MKADRIPVPMSPIPTPMRAVMMGRPMASRDPNEMSSTTTATPRPMSSEDMPWEGPLASTTSPPSSVRTSTPSTFPIAVVSRSKASLPTSSAATGYRTWA